jgi:hypothetical protein
MDNNKCSYTLIKQILGKRLLFMTMFIVGASLTVIPLTMVPQQVDAAPVLIPQLTTCSSINDKSNAECKQVKDRTDDNYDNCYTRSATSTTPAADNCKITQTAKASNNFINSETEAKIYQEVNSLVDCDYGASYCLAHTFNAATQNVDVQTWREGTFGPRGAIDFDVDQKLTQKIATDGQDRFVSKNTMTQNFYATAKPSAQATSSNTATIDADGSDAHIDMYATQVNDECDDSTCTNTGTQTYDLKANGRSSIDASHNQGLQLYQTNNCDDDDTGTLSIACDNISTQLVTLVSGAPNSNDDASIKFDTLDNMVVDQYVNCDFGQFDCKNTATTNVNAFAGGTGSINMDNIEQDVDQTSNCNDLNTQLTPGGINSNIGCENKADVYVEAFATNDPVATAPDGKITVSEGEQKVTQADNCDNAACFNNAILSVSLGDTTLFSNPFDGSGTVNADYSQIVDQENNCIDEANCVNQATVRYFALADDGSVVNSISDQTVTQFNQCSDANCANTGILFNTVGAQGTAVINSEVTQNLEQSCIRTSGNCLNFNDMSVSASGSSGFLDYLATQNVQNTNQNNDGTSSITYTVSSANSPYTPQPVTQTGPGTITNPPE